MGVHTWVQDWPVYRQLTGTDPLGRGAAASSAATRELRPRTATADRVVKSACPYCAVGCARHGRGPGGHLQRLWLLRTRVPVQGHRPTP